MKTLTKAQRLAKRSRRHARGAALVEAAVVVPVMLVFAGCIMFAHRSYAAKMDKQMGTRAGILYYASHNCEGELPPGTVPPVKQSADPGTGDVPGGPATDSSRLSGDQGSAQGAAAGIDKSWSMAKASPADTPVYGSAINDRKTVLLNRTITAASEAGCNEKPYPNKWSATFEFFGSFFRSGGGL
ncbi:MAG: hypothetical protein JWP87_4152 [Labilithrix sp.]|nr:hypothetical protein [Labilithrix sp.]